MLGSAIISAAKDGVDRFGTPSNGGAGGPVASSSSGTLSPSGGDSSNEGYSYAGNLNENLNLKNIGKFFRRDLGGFGGRFSGRGGEDGGG